HRSTCTLCVKRSRTYVALRSFPTRRSSDLNLGSITSLITTLTTTPRSAERTPGWINSPRPRHRCLRALYPRWDATSLVLVAAARSTSTATASWPDGPACRRLDQEYRSQTQEHEKA